MKNFFAHLTTQRKFGLLALVLGFFAIFAGSPYNRNKITLNAKDLALIAEKKADNVSVQDVANWIIQGKVDFRIIDTRPAGEYAAYHIPMAQNIRLSGLLDQHFYPTDKLILYSDTGEEAAQGWFILKGKKYKAVYILKGGLDAWKNQILFPQLPANPTPEQLTSFNKIKEVSKFFGGTPQTDASEDQNQPQVKNLPKLQLPENVPNAAPRKRRKEGC